MLIQGISSKYRIYPACLPMKQRKSTFGYHSGWSNPIPFHILSKYAPGFTKFYRDFFKQVHYKMNILERCEDTDSLAIGGMQEFPTNTYYPPGTVCARNTYSQACFFSGESGSPLMIRYMSLLKLYYTFTNSYFHQK